MTFHFNAQNEHTCAIEKPMKKQYGTVFAFHPLSGKKVFTLGSLSIFSSYALTIK